MTRRGYRLGASLLLAVGLLTGCAGETSAVAVPGGTTWIGSDSGRLDERPAFRTEVASFLLDRTPVTVAAFSRFVTQTGYVTEAERLGSGAVMTFGSGQWQLVQGADWRHPQGPASAPAPADHPVTQVSWNDAQAYCRRQGQRLPREIEYEYVLRLGEASRKTLRANVWTGRFPSVNTAADGYALTSPVGAFGRDALGLSDLAGNVWEWVEDWYRPYGDAAPTPLPVNAEKVQRGGSFLCDAQMCSGYRATSRGHATPDSALMHVGFRCAQSLPG